MAENPFCHRGPIKDPSFFFGRQDEVRRALGLLKQHQSLSVIGQRRIGKTSFLNYISHPQSLATYGLSPERFLFAFVDCQELDSRETSENYACIVEAIEERLPPAVRGSISRTGGRPTVSYDTLRRIVKHAHQAGLQIVVMFDEFEYMTRNDSLDSSFFPSLRSLTVKHDVAFVTTTREPLMRLKYARLEDVGSPFFNFFFPLQLDLFERRVSQDMVRALVGRDKSGLGETILDWIVSVGGNQPFLTQIAGYWAWEVWREKGRLEPRDMKELRSAVYEDMEGHFLYCWHHLTEKEQETLASLPNRDRTLTVERLIQLDLVVEEDGQFGLFSPLFATFVSRQNLPNMLRAGLLRLDLQQRQVYVGECPIDLSPSQYLVLRLMVERLGQLVLYEDLEREIWPDELYQGPERIKGVISKLRTALGSVGEYIENRRGFGYVLQLPEQ